MIRSVVPLVWSGAGVSVDFLFRGMLVLLRSLMDQSQDAHSSSALKAVSELTMLTDRHDVSILSPLQTLPDSFLCGPDHVPPHH